MSCNNCSCKVYPAVNGQIISSRIKNLLASDSFSGLMVIGESPSAVECRSGNIMSGAGAAILKETLEKVGLPYKDTEVYYTTALKCAIPKKKGQKLPTDAPLNCRDYLLHEIKTIKPTLILVCGSTALTALTGKTGLKVTEMYGRVLDYTIEGAQVLPIMNPGVLVHKPGDYKPFLSYLTLAATIFNGGQTVDTGVTTWTVLRTEVDCAALWQKMRNMYEEGLLPLVSYDMETTGLDARDAEFLVLGIGFEKNHVYVLPRELKHLAQNFLEGVPWRCLWQHGKYDKKVIWARELGRVKIDEDVLYMHYVLDETSAHDLGYLTKVYLNAKEYKYKMNQNWKAVSLDTYESFFEALCERVSVDVDYTLQLWHVFDKILSQPENKVLYNTYRNLLIPAANMLTRVEQNGILINAKYLDGLAVKYEALLKQILIDVDMLAAPFWDPLEYSHATGAKTAPAKFNPGSSKQMSWMVFNRLKLKPRVKKGISTGKDILDSIENPPDLIKKVLEYRTVQKEYSTYVIGLLEARWDDGRVRTGFTLHVTATGRLSSKEPNIQNQPASHGVGDIRKAFIPRPGYVFAEIDYSGAELRWLAFLSKCPVLGDIFRQGRNLHKETATALFGKGFSSAEKMIAKALNFGIAYGREAKSIADTFNIAVAEAQKMIDDWLNTYYGARDYLNWCAEQVLKGNYLETPWGRRRRFGVVSEATLHNLQNEAKNFPIQSASSDTLLEACIEMEPILLEKYDTRILNLIHDSTLLEIPADPDIIREVGRTMNACMVDIPKKLFNCNIPFKTDFEIGVNWAEVVTFDYSDSAIESGNNISWEDEKGDLQYSTFDKWYVGAITKEDRYPEVK